jgi:hypothetical protein
MPPLVDSKEGHIAPSSGATRLSVYFFTFAHLAFCAAAILARSFSADHRFRGAESSQTRAAANEPKTALAKEFNVSRETLYQALRPGYAVPCRPADLNGLQPRSRI